MISHRCVMSVKAGAKICYEYTGQWSEDMGKAWTLSVFTVTGCEDQPVVEDKIRILYCPYCGKKLKKPKREKDGGGDEQA